MSQLIVIDESTFDQGFSQSEITTWDECPEKWYRGYNQRLHLPGISWPLLYGTAVHKNLELHYQGELRERCGDGDGFAMLQIPDGIFPTAEQDADLRYWNLILQAQMERYFVHWAAADEALDVIPEGTEQIMETEFMGVKLRGKIDMMFRPKKGAIVLRDHKTSSRYSPDLMDSWYYKFQFMFYVWLARRVTGMKINEFEVNLIVKPQLRLKKDESVESFAARCKADMIQEPDKYFKRIPLPLMKGCLEEFETNVLIPKILRIKALTDVTQSAILPLLVRNRNTNNCSRIGMTCPFIPLCVHGEKEKFRYQTRQYKHEELDTNIE